MGTKDIFPIKKVQVKLKEGLVMVSMFVLEAAGLEGNSRNEVIITNLSEKEVRKRFEHHENKVVCFSLIDFEFIELTGGVPEIYRNRVLNHIGSVIESNIEKCEGFYFV